MAYEHEIEQRAQAMLETPDDLPAIMKEVLSNPQWRPCVAMVLRDACEVYGTFGEIMTAAARQAAKEELDFDRWIMAQDARFDQELEEAFQVKTEWDCAREAA